MVCSWDRLFCSRINSLARFVSRLGYEVYVWSHTAFILCALSSHIILSFGCAFFMCYAILYLVMNLCEANIICVLYSLVVCVTLQTWMSQIRYALSIDLGSNFATISWICVRVSALLGGLRKSTEDLYPAQFIILARSDCHQPHTHCFRFVSVSIWV